MATNPFDQFDTAEVNPFDKFDTPEKPSAIRRLGDAGISVAKGIIGVPEAAVGIADLVTGGQAGKLAESAGFRPKEAKAILSEYYSPQQKAANAEVDQAQGFLPTVGAMLQNPSTIVNSALESAPSMIGGGAISRGLLKVAPRIGAIAAGAAGEGAVAAGQNAEQVRQEDANGLLTGTQSAILAASGLLTGGLSLASGKLSNKLGIGDIQTQLAAGKLGTIGAEAGAKAASKGLIRKTAEGFATEGITQELPQSYQEQVAQNIAQGKPWDEGASKAGAQGMMAGGLMGSGGAVAGHFGEKPMGALEAAASLAPKSIPLTEEGAQKRADAQSTAEGKPYEVVPSTVAGRFTTQEVSQPLTEALNAATSDNNVDTQPSPPNTGGTGLDDRLRNDNPRGSAVAAGQEAAPRQNGALAAVDGTGDAGNQGRTEAVNPIQSAYDLRESTKPRIQDTDILDNGKPFATPFTAAKVANELGEGYKPFKLPEGNFVVRKADDAQSAQAQAVETGAVAGTTAEKPAAADTTPRAGVVEANGVKSYTEKFHGKVPEVTRISADKLEPKNTIEMSGARSAQEGSGLSPEAWAKTIDLSEPIQASVFSDGGVQVQDGHHRMLAAKILGKPLNVDLQAINAKPEAINGLIAESTTLSSQPKEINGTQAAKAVQTTQKGQAQPTAGAVTKASPSADLQAQRKKQQSGQPSIETQALLTGNAPADQSLADNQPSQQAGGATIGGQSNPENSQKIEQSSLGKPVLDSSSQNGTPNANPNQARNAAVPDTNYLPPAAVSADAGRGRVPADRLKPALQPEPKMVQGVPEAVQALGKEVSRDIGSAKQGRSEANAKQTAKDLAKQNPALDYSVEADDKLKNGYVVVGREKVATQNIAPQATDAPASGTIAPKINEAAHAAATSPKNGLPQPTPAQKEAGNYQKGHISLHGMDIAIENPVGSTRSGTDAKGKPWSNTMRHHYGYIKGTVGMDKDHVDTFIGDKPESQKVFVVDQIDPRTGKPDEHKVMLGFDTLEAAQKAYQANYAKDWTGGKAVTETTVDGFKTWLKEGDTKKPFAVPPGLAKMQAAKAVKDAASNTPEAIARQIQTTVADNRRAAQEKSRLANTAKGYAANTTPESEQASYDKEVAEPVLAGNIATAKAILDKDVPALIQRFVNGNFEASEKAFHKITGVKINGLSAANKKAALYKWADFTPEQMAAQEKAISDKQEARSAKFKDDEAKANVKSAWGDLGRMTVKQPNGDTITGQAFIQDMVAKGFDEVHSTKKGVAVLYGLKNDKTFQPMKHKNFTAFLKAARDFGGLKQALGTLAPSNETAKQADGDIAKDFAPPKENDAKGNKYFNAEYLRTAGLSPSLKAQYDKTQTTRATNDIQKMAETRAKLGHPAPATMPTAEQWIATPANKRGELFNAPKSRTTEQASHQDPGQKPEAATTPVIAESLQKAQEWSKTRNGGKPSDMKANLLAQIDAAFKETADYADYQKAVADRGQDVADTIFIKSASSAGYTATEGKGQITFDVPGDGKFKIQNTLRGLYEFRVKVEKSPGFKDTASGKYKFIRKEPGEKGSASIEAALANMLEERDFEAAMAYREATGTNLNDVKISPEARADFKAYLKDGTQPTVFSPAKDWKIEPGKYALDTLNAHGASRTWEQDGHTYMARVYGNKDGARYSMQDNGAILVKDEGARNFIEAMQAAEEAPARLATEQVAADKQRVIDEQKQAEGAKKAAKLLLQHTKGTGVFYDLRGVQNVKNRIAIMSALEDKPAYTYKESEAPSHLEIQYAFEKRSGVDRSQPKTVVDAAFQTWLKEVATDKAAQEEVRVRREAQTKEAERQPTEHEGVKIYPTTFKGEPYWSVQIERNRGTDRMFGDTLHKTLEDAKKEATLQARNVKDLAERRDVAEQEQAAVQAKKDANKGKSIVERHNDAVLDKRTTLHPNAGLGNGTRREAMQKAVEQERLVKAVMVEDNAAKKRDQDFIDRNRNLPTGNVNYPGVKEYFEAKDRLQANKYEKPDYRVYMGRSDRDSFYNISKTEFDYAQKLKEEAQTKESAKKYNPYDAPFVKADALKIGDYILGNDQTKAINAATGTTSNLPTQTVFQVTKINDKSIVVTDTGTGENYRLDKQAWNSPNTLEVRLLDKEFGDKAKPAQSEAKPQEAATAAPVVAKDTPAFSRKTIDVQNQTESEAFKRWSNDAPLITSAAATTHEFKTGEKVVLEAFHGAGRPDRIGGVFKRSRATSGPMAYHTSDPELASNYAKGKPDTSLALEDNPYQNWFKYKPQGQRTAVSIDRAWYALTPEQKATIAERMPDIRQDDDANIIYEKGGGDIGSYEWNLKQTQRGFDKRGNPLAAAVETWLNSGAIFGNEQEFMQVLKLAGFPIKEVNFDHPHETFPSVYKNYIEMQNPLVVSDIPQRVVDALDAAAKTDRSRAQKVGADTWDKNTRTLKEWVATFHEKNNEYVWTSIPDKVTEVFESLGFDGIIDKSGKGGGAQHPVYIPFKDVQIKSAIGNRGTFDAGKKDINYSRRANPQTDTPAFRESDYRPVIVSWAKDEFGDRIAPSGNPTWQNFVRWFGDSKVVDSAGRPLVVYHGTKSDFTIFDLKAQSQGSDKYGKAFYFTSSPKYASQYAMASWSPGDGSVGAYYIKGDQVSKERDVYIVKNSEDIKSATGNNGNFDPTNPDIRYSQGSAATGLPITQVQSITDAIKSKWENAPEIIVAANMDDKAIPQAVRDHNNGQLSQGAEGSPEGFLYGGKVYLVADQLNTPTDVMRVLFHETLGHVGLRGVFGKELTPILQQIAMFRKAEVQAKAKEYGLDMSKESDRLQAAEEVLAVLAQTKPELGFVKRAVAAIRTWLKAHGVKLELSDSDIIANYILPARNFVQSGKEANFNGATAFSRLDNFKAWFGNSRVKDMSGQAATVYHGTASDFSVFDKLKLGSQTAHHATSKLGFFFTTNAEKAGTFATGEGANVMAVKLKIENPYQMTVTEAGQITTEDMARAKREDLQKAGYDGIRIANGGIWVAFEANQIKSATGNNGNFDASNPDIRFSRTGDVVDALRSANTLRQATNSVKDMLHTDRTFNMWERTIGTQSHKASKSAPFKRVFEAYNNQTDDIAHYAIEAERFAPSVLQRLDGFQETVKAVVSSFSSKYKADITAIAKPLLANIEGVKGVKQVKYDTQSLKQIFNLTDKQVEMYKQVRLSVDTSLERLAQTYAAQMGADQGIPIDTLRDMGLQETVDLVKEYVTQADTEQSAALLKRLDDMVAQTTFLQDNAYMPAMRFGNFAVTMKDGDTVAHFSMYDSQLKANIAAGKLKRENPSLKVSQSLMNEDRFKMFKGVSPETVELFAQFTGMDSNEAYQDYIALAKSGRSSAKRLLEREGVAGFDEDITRILASFVSSNARQAAMNMNQSEITAAMSAKDLQGDVQNEAQKLDAYMSDPQEEAHRLRGFLFLHYIGGSIASAFVNLTQPILQTTPYLSQFAGLKTTKIMLSAAKMAATGNIAEHLKTAMARAKAEGITDPHEIHNLMADASGATMGGGLRTRALVKAWGSLFSISEAYNRRLTFLAAYQVGLDMGEAQLKEKGFKDAYDFSKHAIIETQGLYSKTNRPNWARGAIGATLFTFKQFSISYVEFLSRLPNKQKAIALGLLVLAAGLQGLPGADDLEDLIDTIGQSLGYNTNSKRALRQTAVDLLGEDLGLLLTHGMSSMTNVDLQGRLGMGNLLPGTGLFKMSEKDKTRSATEFAGALGGVLNSAMDAIAKAQKGEIWGKTGALATMSPVTIRNFLQGAEAMQTGVYTDTRGRKVQDIDGAAAFLKMFGFQPGDIAQESRKMSELMQTKGMMNAVSGAISDKWAESVATGDKQGVADALATLQAWNKNNPESRIILNPSAIRQKIRAFKMTREQRFLKTLPKTMRAQAMEELG